MFRALHRLAPHARRRRSTVGENMVAANRARRIALHTAVIGATFATLTSFFVPPISAQAPDPTINSILAHVVYDIPVGRLQENLTVQTRGDECGTDVVARNESAKMFVFTDDQTRTYCAELGFLFTPPASATKIEVSFVGDRTITQTGGADFPVKAFHEMRFYDNQGLLRS